MLSRTHSVDIARPPEVVFSYVTDPAKLSTWQNADEVTQLTPGPVGAGTRFREVQKSMGKRRTQITEVVGFEPARRFEIRVVEGPPIDGRWDFESIPHGTRLTFTPLVRLSGPRKLAAPLMAFGTALVFSRFHGRLKRALETPTP